MRKLGTNPKKMRRMDEQRRKYGRNMERNKKKVEEAIPEIKKRRYRWRDHRKENMARQGVGRRGRRKQTKV